MDNKKRAIFVLCIVAMTALLPALLLVFYVDPFQIYHKPFISDMSLQGNQRYQNAGLINSYLADPEAGYDSIIVGTSMSQNFTADSVSKTLQWKKPLRLLMPGAVAEEQLAVLRHALDTGNVKHVLLELHPFLYQDMYRQKKQIVEDPTLYFPAFLYNDNWLDDAAYVFNIDVLKMSWRIVKHDAAANKITPETIGYWGGDENVGSDHDNLNSADNLKKIQEATHGFVLKAKSDAEIQAINYLMLEDALIPLLNNYCNSGVEIVMFVPPWPRFRYQKSEKVTLRSVYMMRRILDKTSNCTNISLYDFDVLDFAGDLNNYKDDQHYLPAINQVLLDHIAHQENRLVSGNVGEFENDFIRMLNGYVVHSRYATEALRN